MVRHMIMWQLKEEFTGEEKAKILQGIKEGLEGLVGVVPGLVSAKVYTELLPSSNADVMLDAEVEAPELMEGYRVHPAHVAVANEKVRPYTRSRTCVDLEV